MASGHDAEKFLKLLEPVRHSLYRFALKNLWRRDLAVDVVQESVMTAWRHFHKFEEGTNFRAWMFKILLNTLYRVNRRTNRSREVHADGEMFDVEQTLQRETAWESILENPQRVLEGLDDRVVTALQTLAPTERHCFLLRLLEEFSYKEIAEQLSLPMGTVMSHVYRARMKLRELLAGLALEEGLVRSPGSEEPA